MVVDDELRRRVGLGVVGEHERVLTLVRRRVPGLAADVLDAFVHRAGVVVEDAAGDEVGDGVFGVVPDTRRMSRCWSS